ncbi:hypothetical protein FQA39_LY01097 [Lamprigera yunnana]|nr:hypothetical protein FQA39_LY01097 [Lamprigera yunnana]
MWCWPKKKKKDSIKNKTSNAKRIETMVVEKEVTTEFSSSFSSKTTAVTKTASSQSTMTSPASKTLLTVDAKPIAVYHSQPYRSAFNSSPLSVNRNRNLPSTSRTVNLFNNTLEVPGEAQSIDVKRSTKFLDDPLLLKEPFYKTRSKNRGKLLLINNIKFNNEHQRDGAELDELNLIKVYKSVGFEVEKHQNLSLTMMQNKITNFRNNKSLGKFDIITVIVMSHGVGTEQSESTAIVSTDGKYLGTEWIIGQFNNSDCKHLQDKPKIFIFQCCRGEKFNEVQHDSVPVSRPRGVSDILIAYSTIPGFVSYREPTRGSWYIRSLCKIFMEHAHDTDVEKLLKMADGKLSNLEANGQKQTATFINRGFKTCYLHPKIYEEFSRLRVMN